MAEQKNSYEHKGLCPICDRDMYDDGKSINRHHFIPKCRGGKEQFFLHTLCHNFLHGLWTEKQLEKEYSDPQVIKQNPEIQKFIAWLQKKDPLFYIKTKDSNERKKRRK